MKIGMNRTLLYEEVVEALYKLIDEHKIKPGDQFPSERELVKKWDISRNVLREAFHILENRGIIMSRQGKGRFLRTLPDKEYDINNESLSKKLERYSLLEIYETRQVLETKAVELVVKYASDDDIREICEYYDKLYKALKESDSTNGEFDMHRMYAKKCKNNFLEQIINIAFKTTFEIMNSTFHDVLIVHTVEESMKAHGEIIEAMKCRDAERAGNAMKNHIQRTIDILL
jgi:DNA-binding FadR family transcriptional regulator